MIRVRQLVLVAAQREGVVRSLCDTLHGEVCFEDPGVGVFGLHNALLAVGDDFVEVVAPLPERHDGTAAHRHLARLGGDGGYMAIIQVDDAAAVKARAVEQGHRVIWEGSVTGPPAIHGVHLHPEKLGTIVSVDQAEPAGSWVWAGPEWEAHRIPGCTGIAGGTLAVADPAAVLASWAALFDRPATGDRVVFDDGSWIQVVQAPPGHPDALVRIDLHADDPALVGRQVAVGSATVGVIA